MTLKELLKVANPFCTCILMKGETSADVVVELKARTLLTNLITDSPYKKFADLTVKSFTPMVDGKIKVRI